MNTNCGKEWTRKFLVNNFTKSFVTGPFKKNREKILLDREMALLPATQGVVEGQIQKEKILKEVVELEKLIKDLTRQKHTLLYTANNSNVAVNKERKFIRACPDEDCRGFLSTQWKCGLCESFTCPDCHVIKGADRNGPHTCNPDELATAQLLDKDTKPCPKCATGIFKIEGCDQMWCTQCHTAFSWKSGQIETNIHNPHFYEWQRRNGGGVAPRAPGDVLCGREITHRTAEEFRGPLGLSFAAFNESNLKKLSPEQLFMNIQTLIRGILHLKQDQMPGYRVDQVANNLDLRVKYMRNQIDKDTFQSRIHRDNKKHEKKREMNEILGMFIQAVTDIVYRALDYCKNNVNMAIFKKGTPEEKTKQVSEVNNILNEIDAIRLYSNECLAEIAETYDSKAMHIVLYISTAACSSSIQARPQYGNILVTVPEAFLKEGKKEKVKSIPTVVPAAIPV